MNRLFMFILLFFVMCTIGYSIPPTTVRWQGDLFDSGKVLVSSTGIKPDGYNIPRVAIASNTPDGMVFFSSYSIIPEDLNYTTLQWNDWVFVNDGPYDIWLDSSTDVKTSGDYEAGKIKSGQSFRVGGRNIAKVYARRQEALTGYSTIYWFLSGNK